MLTNPSSGPGYDAKAAAAQARSRASMAATATTGAMATTTADAAVDSTANVATTPTASASATATSTTGGTSRSRASTLATTPDAGPSSPRKKRKLDDEGEVLADMLLREAIVVKPHPPNLSIKPRVLQPLMVLPRAHLALSLLDLASPMAGLPCVGTSRLVEAHVRALDLEKCFGGPAVLIARSDATGAVYALDRHEGNLYAACRLGEWAVLEELRGRAVACSRRMSIGRKEVEGKRVGVDVDLGSGPETPAMHRAQKKKKVEIEAFQSLVKQRARSQSVCQAMALKAQEAGQGQKEGEGEKDLKAIEAANCPEQGPDKAEKTPAQDGEESGQQNEDQDGVDARDRARSLAAASEPHDQAPLDQTQMPPPPQLAPTEVLENIRTQYLDTLYKSMGSLAYFAKGPLSRARAALLPPESTLTPRELVDFLKSLVLTTVQIDTKYRETIPALVGQMAAAAAAYVDSSDEGRKTAAAAARARGRKPRKMRVARNGLYPGEDDMVRAWWAASREKEVGGEADGEDTNDGDGDGEKQREAAAAAAARLIRSRALLLRTRETQLQMMLILEVLALEPTCATEEGGAAAAGTTTAGTSATTTEVTASATTPATTADPPPRKRNKNLPVLVDLHADRLCIWQSTASEDVTLLQGASAGDGEQASSAEPLRDFCVDIIIPFFSARLHDTCKAINRKLGGPKIISDKAKPGRASAAAAKRGPKPGAATKRPMMRPGSGSAAARPAHHLERALSREMLTRRSESRGPPTALELMRSATATAVIPSFKREGSVGGSVVALKREASDAAGEPSHSQSHSQLLGMARPPPLVEPARRGPGRGATAAASQEQLREAISAIRRPNRQQVGRAVVEAAERRVAGALKKAGKLAASTPTVVEATPANVRFRNVFGRADSQSQSLSQSFAGRGGGGGGVLANLNANVSANNSSRFEEFSDDVIPPSSVTRVPDTLVRLGFRDLADGGEHHVAATPSAGPRHRGGGGRSRVSALVDHHGRGDESDDCVPASSPLLARAFGKMDADAIVEDSGGGARRAARRPLTHVANRSIFATPTKGAAAAGRAYATPTRVRGVVGFGSDDVDAAIDTPTRANPSRRASRAGGLAEGGDTRTYSSSVADKASSVVVGGEGGAKEKKGGSIYQRLGWDDEDDELA